MVSVGTNELSFLVARMVAKRDHSHPRCYGMSSDALALYAIGQGPRPRVPGTEHLRGCWQGEECGHGHPHDPADLLACELTYEMAPEHLRERMLPVLIEFRAWVLDGINCHGERAVQHVDYRSKVFAMDEWAPHRYRWDFA